LLRCPCSFSSYVDPLDLPPFPTRRSSDLPDQARDLLLGQGAVEEMGPVGDRLSRLQPVEGFEILRQDPHAVPDLAVPFPDVHAEDRKSTRLNSSHVSISYAVFCLKKKKIH